MKSKKLNDCLNRFHVAMPKPRNQKERPPYIPEVVLEAKTKKVEQAAEKQIKLEKDLEDENGGADDFNCHHAAATTLPPYLSAQSTLPATEANKPFSGCPLSVEETSKAH
ncbi:Nucleolar GTP-binding protein 1 [Forsythia ovata]|uniref:Nucleolar GTP-binding protein 1 n=1 Tax=Forsythia ovata TaxID=205694 RepID=A0ABD1SLU5_9LAMI